MRYFIIAGEASGDLHGSNLIYGLKKEDPEAEINCWGGDLMQKAGGNLIKHYKESAVMGFVEVLANLKQILHNIKRCKEDIIKFNPDLLILIDYPGFNLKIAKFAHSRGIPVFYYIAPKVWAWKENRVKLLKKYIDKLFIIFPFEIEYFKSKGIEAVYCGNPLLDSVDNHQFANEDKLSFCKRYNLDPQQEFIALLAGSRKNEIKYLLPRMTRLCQMEEKYHYLLAAAPAIDKALYEKIIGESGCNNITIIYNDTYSVLRQSRAAIINSGTASLEGTLINVPQVVCYGGSEISYRIAKAVVKLKYISLANLILDKHIFKELIQHDCTPEKIHAELKELTSNTEYRDKMMQDYAKVRELLGGKGASVKVARRMIDEGKKILAGKINHNETI